MRLPNAAFLLPLFLLLLPACRTTEFRYHEYPGRFSALKVYPYWEGNDGEKYLVGGLNVALLPKIEDVLGADDFITEVTNVEDPLLIEELVPGTYRLRVYLDEDTHVIEEIELPPGKRLTVRVDVEAVRRNERIEATIKYMAGRAGEAMVLIGGHIFDLLIEALIIKGQADDDDENWDRPSKKKKKGKPPPLETPEEPQKREARESKRRR